jgi:hypothetical protein
VGEKQQAQQGEKPHPVCFADIPLLHKGEGVATSPYCPSPSTRRGTFRRKPKQGEVRIGGQETTGSTRSEKPHPVCFADIPLLHKGEGIATSPCRSATSLSFTRRGTFWRKPKQGEVRTGGQETTGSTRRETSPCLLRRHPSPSQRRGNCDLTLLSLSFNKERDVLAVAKTG